MKGKTKKENGVEMYIIVMSAHSRMLLGSLMKTSTTGRGGGGSELCVRRSSRGWKAMQTSLS